MKGIYKIVNKKNGKFYIGSSVDIETRWNTHKSRLRNGKHHSSKLQRSWIKYGEDNFDFIVLEEMNSSTYQEILDKEQNYLNILSPFEDAGYNLVKEVYGGLKGYKHTEETKKKISERNKHKKFSEESRLRMSKSAKFKTLKEETKNKMSQSHKGKTSWNKGLKTPEHVRSKLSKALKGRLSPMKNKRHSQETKNKMKENRKGEKNSNSKLNFDIAKQIRILYLSGISQRKLGEMFNVSRGCIQGILKNKTWIENE